MFSSLCTSATVWRHTRCTTYSWLWHILFSAFAVCALYASPAVGIPSPSYALGDPNPHCCTSEGIFSYPLMSLRTSLSTSASCPLQYRRCIPWHRRIEYCSEVVQSCLYRRGMIPEDHDHRQEPPGQLI